MKDEYNGDCYDGDGDKRDRDWTTTCVIAQRATEI